MKNFILLFTLLLLPIIANHARGVTIGSSTNAGFDMTINGDHQPFGQSFQAEGTGLESFSFHYMRGGPGRPDATIPFTLSIHAGIGNGGSLIGAKSFSLNGAFNGLHAVNFSSLGSVFTIGDQYSAMITTTDNYFLAGSNNGYANGTVIAGGNSGDYDLLFSATFSVPDTGSTAALLGVGAAALAFARRRLG